MSEHIKGETIQVESRLTRSGGSPFQPEPSPAPHRCFARPCGGPSVYHIPEESEGRCWSAQQYNA